MNIEALLPNLPKPIPAKLTADQAFERLEKDCRNLNDAGWHRQKILDHLEEQMGEYGISDRHVIEDAYEVFKEKRLASNAKKRAEFAALRRELRARFGTFFRL